MKFRVGSLLYCYCYSLPSQRSVARNEERVKGIPISWDPCTVLSYIMIWQLVSNNVAATHWMSSSISFLYHILGSPLHPFNDWLGLRRHWVSGYRSNPYFYFLNNIFFVCTQFLILSPAQYLPLRFTGDQKQGWQRVVKRDTIWWQIQTHYSMKSFDLKVLMRRVSCS